ncbi:saccharopine dehydrogenase [Campylobacter sp. Marseille-Q3452]|uniref:Saccharopine dehydrogenase n=1 Tax=Campylobacter massiliensis TaxID=2762557 RepID=A0A842JCG4_9BACT|nr:saccharopine dehydrogenase [Campylobacter massiliensis]MBC2883732.1 saccharopine dehydrogenase [Campylobacter massiliensis]
MKIVLVNANPAVSRLATLALSKMGYEYVEIGDVSELSGVFDVLIIDSDIDAKEMNLKEFANKILYLSSKNSPTFENADRILPKPFLPTEFITIVEDLASKTKSAEPTAKDETAEVSVKGFEFIDDPAEDVFEDEIMELDPGELRLDDELDDISQAASGKDSAFDELNEIVKAIDDMDELSEKLGDEELDLHDADDEAMEFEEFEIAAKDDKFDDFSADLDAPDELMDIKFETTDEPELAELGATEFVAADGEEGLEEAQDKFELDFDGSIEDIKHQIDEIDKMDELSENLDASDEPSDTKFETADELDMAEFADMDSADEPEVPQSLERTENSDKFTTEEAKEQDDIFADIDMKFDEPDEQMVQVKNSALGDEFLLGDTEAVGETELAEFATEENLAQDVLDGELAEDIFAADEQDEAEAGLEQDVQEIIESDDIQNEPEIVQELHPSEYGDIEQISEKDMAMALNESGFEGGEAANLSSQKAQTTSKINELKAQISDAVAKNLENSLQDGELREALKNLNIKINISFEEK